MNAVSRSFCALVAAAFAAVPGAVCAEAGRRAPGAGDSGFLSGHTLAYPGRDGKENLIHFGRFGNFDWYFPCAIESGTWSLAADGVLSLTYDNTDFEARSYRIARRGGRVLMIEPDRTTEAFIASGNLLPYT